MDIWTVKKWKAHGRKIKMVSYRFNAYQAISTSVCGLEQAGKLENVRFLPIDTLAERCKQAMARVAAETEGGIVEAEEERRIEENLKDELQAELASNP